MNPSERKPSLMIAIAPKGGPEPPPRPIVRATGGRPSSTPGRMNTIAADPDKDSDQHMMGGGTGGKMSPEEALVVRADKHCQSCQHYQSADGSCEKVDGTFQPEDACMRWYTPLGSSGDAGYNPSERAGGTSSIGLGAGTSADTSPLGLGS